MKITVEQQLKMHGKVSRELNHRVKPIVTKDKKKHANKKACRKKVVW
jgi:hypothetical protein